MATAKKALTVYDKMALDLLQKAKAVGREIHIMVAQWASEYQVEERFAREKLVQLHQDKIIRLSAFHESKGVIPLEQWPDSEYFFNYASDGHHKRVLLLLKGEEFLQLSMNEHIELSFADTLNESNELDDLLPLFRRKVFDADVSRYCDESLKNGNSLVMLMMDIDRFKSFNDTHGHSTGDQVLIGTSTVISERVRGKGKAYRYGGEEFAVLLPNYFTSEGIALAEVIRKVIEESVFGEKKLKVTISIGLSTVPEHAKTPHDLIKTADAALYEAKGFGRNLVRVSGEPRPVEREQLPSRKIAVPGGLSDDDREAIRVTYFGGRQPECPKDGTSLRILKEFHAVGLRTPSTIIMCPLCGLQDIVHGLE